MGIQLFTVLTEFKFEAGSAIATSDKLTQAVGNVSAQADKALGSMQALGLGIMNSFLSGPGGGIIGVLGTALFSFDAFQKKQLQFANVLNQTGMNFHDRMLASADVLESLNKKALEFGLPTDDLIEVTKLITPQLMNKGLAGEGLTNAIDLSRSFLKSAPVLGINPQEAFGQLQRGLEGQASGGDTLFMRLAGETKAMAPFIGNLKAFNQLNPAQRVATLNRALREFSNDVGVNHARIEGLSGQMQILKNQLTGAFSVLRGFGEVLSNLIVPVLKDVNSYIQNNMKAVVGNLARAFEQMAPNAREFIVNLMALRDLQSNLKQSGNMLAFVGGALAINHVLKVFALRALVAAGAVSILVTGISLLGKAVMATVGFFGGFYAVLNGLVVIVSTLLAPLILLQIVFQIISRAIAIAKINDATAFAKAMKGITEMMARFAAITGVFTEGMNNIAALIAPIFELSRYLNWLVNILDFLSTALGLAMAGFQGLAFGIMEFFSQMKGLLSGEGFSASKIAEAYSGGVDMMIERIFGKMDKGENVANNIINNNINKIEINQDFKQQQEPDRIAFTVADTLMKLARNPTQAVGGGFATSGVGR